jgi:hypothetical protein
VFVLLIKEIVMAKKDNTVAPDNKSLFNKLKDLLRSGGADDIIIDEVVKKMVDKMPAEFFKVLAEAKAHIWLPFLAGAINSFIPSGPLKDDIHDFVATISTHIRGKVTEHVDGTKPVETTPPPTTPGIVSSAIQADAWTVLTLAMLNPLFAVELPTMMVNLNGMFTKAGTELNPKEAEKKLRDGLSKLDAQAFIGLINAPNATIRDEFYKFAVGTIKSAKTIDDHIRETRDALDKIGSGVVATIESVFKPLNQAVQDRLTTLRNDEAQLKTNKAALTGKKKIWDFIWN